MIRLIVVLLVAALAWMTWWAVGQTAYEKALTSWVGERRADGWEASFTSLATTGFPNRFDTTISDVTLADSEAGLTWSAPFIQFLSLSYKPHQVIAVLANRHQVATPAQTVTVTHENARASLFFQPRPSLPVDRVRLVVEDIALSSSQGWRAAAAEGRFAASRQPASTDSYRFGADIRALEPAGPVLALLDPRRRLPDTIETFRLDATLGFTGPWDRYALESGPPQVTRIDLADLSAVWGDVSVRLSGELTVDDTGRPEGRVTIRAVQWQTILDMVIAAGLVPEAARQNAENALTAMSRQSDTVEASLDIEDGQIRLGPVPLARVPILRLP